MQKIGPLVNQSANGQQQRGASSRAQPNNARLIVNLWERMVHIYATEWSRRYGESAVDQDGNLTEVARTWSAGLDGISGDRIAIGIRSCIRSGSNFPPTLPAFRAACRVEPMHREYRALPRPDGWREKGLAALAKIKGRTHE